MYRHQQTFLSHFLIKFRELHQQIKKIAQEKDIFLKYLNILNLSLNFKSLSSCFPLWFHKEQAQYENEENKKNTTLNMTNGMLMLFSKNIFLFRKKI